ncbi:glycosyltransferase family 4 protein [Vibrio breoganii]
MVKKVVHVQLLPLLSGVQNVSLNEIKQMKDDFDFSVICSDEGDLTQALTDIGVSFYTINSLCREINLIKDLQSFYKLYKLLKDMKPDIVHTHSSKTGFLGRIAAKFARVDNVIHTVHGFSFPSSNSFISRKIYYLMELVATKFCDKIIVLNDSDYLITKNQLRVHPDKIEIIPNSVDTDLYRPLCSEVKDINEPLRVVMVGRLWEQKNPMCLIKAIKFIRDDGYNVTLDYVGDGELTNNIQKYVVANELYDCVRLLGWNKEVYKILPSYDIFVLPSLWEGMPLAILEAQACGLPTVVSNIPGNKDLVIDGVNGYLFESDNYLDLKEKILLFTDKEKTKEMSVSARDHILSNYSSDKRNVKVSCLYNKGESCF